MILTRRLYRQLKDLLDNRTQLLTIVGIVFILTAIPITVSLLRQEPKLSSQAAANTLTVGSGSYTTIQAAVNAANSGDIVRVLAGVKSEFRPNLLKPLSLAFIVAEDLHHVILT